MLCLNTIKEMGERRRNQQQKKGNCFNYDAVPSDLVQFYARLLQYTDLDPRPRDQSVMFLTTSGIPK